MPLCPRNSATNSTIATASTPQRFNPKQFPILTKHWPGLPPICEHTSAPLARMLADLHAINVDVGLDVEVGPKEVGA